MSAAVPGHIAIIPDGSRRYAKAAGISHLASYGHGLDRLGEMLEWLRSMGVRHISAFAASGENVTGRSRAELIAVFTVIGQVCDKIRALPNTALHVFGDIDGLPAWIPGADRLRAPYDEPNYDEIITVHFAVNYSGSADEARALSAGVPAADLLIRTGGQHRLSGFLPLQTQYAELWFTDTLWPAFEKPEFQEALDWFATQKRNFGK